MIRLILFVLLLLPSLAKGQYIYFNSSYNPPYPSVGGGTTDNLLVVDNGYMTFGFFPAPTYTYATSHYYLDFNGIQQNAYTYVIPNHGGVYNEYSESIINYQDGYLGGRGYYDNSNNKYHGRISRYNSSMQEVWNFDLLSYQQDSIVSSEYSCARSLADGNFIAYGDVTADTIPDQNDWPSNGDIILTKVQPDGTLVWHKQYPFHELNYFNLPQPFVKTNDLIELSNGNLLLWGGWYDPFDPFVIKLDPEGNFLDELHWGNPTLGDWLAWPVQISNFEFMFAYSHAVGPSSLGQVLWDIQLGVLNASTMTISSVHSYNHIHDWGGVVDFEATPDGGYVVLGYGNNSVDQAYAPGAFLMKIDANFNEEWFHAYHPPLPWYTDPNAYDLEVAPDGGLVFVGNFTDNVGPLNHTWVVKTDACGELANNGCEVGIDETQNTPQEVVIYPNPAQDVLNINATRDFVFVKVYNTLGQEVMTTSSPSPVSIQTIDLSALPAGMYEIRLLDENKVVVHTAPLIKN